MNQFLVQIIIGMAEQVGIPVLITILETQLATNPALAAQWRTDLLGASDAIYRTYGITPPTHT